MVSAVNFVDAWLPHLVEPGSVLVLTNTSDGEQLPSFCALLHCPFCLRLIVITEQQFSGETAVTCGASQCPASFLLRDGLPVALNFEN